MATLHHFSDTREKAVSVPGVGTDSAGERQLEMSVALAAMILNLSHGHGSNLPMFLHLGRERGAKVCSPCRKVRVALVLCGADPVRAQAAARQWCASKRVRV